MSLPFGQIRNLQITEYAVSHWIEAQPEAANLPVQTSHLVRAFLGQLERCWKLFFKRTRKDWRQWKMWVRPLYTTGFVVSVLCCSRFPPTPSRQMLSKSLVVNCASLKIQRLGPCLRRSINTVHSSQGVQFNGWFLVGCHLSMSGVSSDCLSKMLKCNEDIAMPWHSGVWTKIATYGAVANPKQSVPAKWKNSEHLIKDGLSETVANGPCIRMCSSYSLQPRQKFAKEQL